MSSSDEENEVYLDVTGARRCNYWTTEMYDESYVECTNLTYPQKKHLDELRDDEEEIGGILTYILKNLGKEFEYCSK